ncbi:MAG: glucose 1-dehydrogenase [Candidatus Latescibacterota bacterium]|nr:glucose 1-dehydrogenase [Candidatus Latescibacterota bacterium]
MVLKNRTAIVTGGSSGIGRGICLEFAREGANVIVSDIQEAPKQGKYHEQDTVTPTVEEVAKLGGQGLFVQTDVANESCVQHLLTRTLERFGSVDIVVNNAGIIIPAKSQQLSSVDWDRVIGVNLKSVFLTTKYCLPHLEQSAAGRIINIASVHAFAGGGGPAYAPTKAGVVNLTKDTAVEVGERGITCNAICPGYIETAIQDYLTAEQIEHCRKATPLPRLGLPRDIGRAAVFLASDDAEWITGAALPVDGGWLAPIIH